MLINIQGCEVLFLCTVFDYGCREDSAGRTYVGNQMYTRSGRLCQRWDQQTPHAHDFVSDDE